MALGIANLTNLANHIRELYDKPFANMRDSEKGFMTRLKRKEWPKSTYNYKIRDAEYSPVWSIAESDLTSLITSTILATDGVGDATAFLAPNNHPFLNAAITLRINVATVEVSGLAESATESELAAWVQALDDETKQATADLWRKMNEQILSTATTAGNSGKNLDGLGVAFNTAASHSYGGLSTGTYPELTTAADTTAQGLLISSMQTMRNKLEGNTESLGGYSTKRASKIKEWWASPEQFTAYGNLLTGLRRYNASETMDGGFAKLEFYGRPVLEIPNFPSTHLIPYSEKDGGLFHVVHRNLETQDKSANIVWGHLIELINVSNIVLTNRTKQGVFNALQ